MRIADCGLRNCRKSLKPGRDQERWRRAKGERKCGGNADCGMRIAKLPKELETRPRSRAVATGERREEMRIAELHIAKRA